MFAKIGMLAGVAVAIGIAINHLTAVGAILYGRVGARVIHVGAAINGFHMG